MRVTSLRFFLLLTVTIATVGFFSLYAYTFVARASIYNLYASTCLGGWENTHLASGAPQATEAGSAPVFTEGNSARLDSSTHAQIYCGGFTGDIAENTVPKKVLVKFSWGVEYNNINVEAPHAVTNIPESTPSLPEQNLEIPQIIEEIIPQEESQELLPESASQEPSVSILNFFTNIAHAEDVLTTVSPTTDTASVPSYGLVEVLYTLNGVDWKSLGFVEKDEFGAKYFEIPIEEASNWEGISKIQIGIESMPVVDGAVPTIYLDSVWIETEYEHESEAIEQQPASVIAASPNTLEQADGQVLSEDVEEDEELSPDDMPVEEVLEPAVSEPSLSVRNLLKDIALDSNASHSCRASPFSIDVSGRQSFSTTLSLSRLSEGAYEVEIGSLPVGIDVRFSTNHDYLYTVNSSDEAIKLDIVNEDGSNKGNFNIPIIFTKKDKTNSSVICQINIVNL